jgi:hypothetical protein
MLTQKTINYGTKSSHDPDYFLGPSEKRYFGSTYKKTEHIITNLIVRGNRLYGDLIVQWPQVWSQKGGGYLTPHVGTLDFFVVATRFVEHHMGMVDDRSTEHIERTWMSNFFCKAGSRFIESYPYFCNMAQDRGAMFCQCSTNEKSPPEFGILFGDFCGPRGS